MRLTPPRQMSLDEAIEYLAEDELLEVTPLNYRIRKRILNTEERGKTDQEGQGSRWKKDKPAVMLYDSFGYNAGNRYDKPSFEGDV